MIKRKVIFISLIFIFFTAPMLLLPVQVDWVSGNVTYSHLKSEWETLEVGMNLISGDIVKTGVNSETTLLDNGNEIYILANSSFTVSEKYEQEKKKSTFMLFLGRMRFKLGKSGEEEPDIQTQTVNLTIRGTEFEVGSGYDGSTIVLIKEGSVAVQGKKSELVLAEGEGTEVAFGEEPTEKFEVITRVIDWDAWFSESQEAVKGNETQLLGRILERFKEIDAQIKAYEVTRANAQHKKEEWLKQRDKLMAEGKNDEAAEYSKKAGGESKLAFHSLVNIRFLALSSIGLHDMAERIYTGIEKPPKEADELFDEIKKIYKGIEDKYILEGDRERLEKKAQKKKGCIKLF